MNNIKNKIEKQKEDINALKQKIKETKKEFSNFLETKNYFVFQSTYTGSKDEISDVYDVYVFGDDIIIPKHFHECEFTHSSYNEDDNYKMWEDFITSLNEDDYVIIPNEIL